MAAPDLSRVLARPAVTFVGLWLGLFLATVAWAFATPLSGSPDEPAHIVKAASVVRGQLLGEPTEAPAVRSVQVPESIGLVQSWPCFAFHPDVSANCTGETWGGSPTVTALTSAGLYNPLYYALIGWPSLLAPANAAAAVYGMRIVSALLVTLFLTAAFAAMVRLVPGRLTALAFAAAVTPMMLFLGGAVNPNALEAATGLALLGSLLVVLSAEPPLRRWPWLVLAAVSGVILAQSRGLSPLWMLLIATVVLIMTPWPQVVRELRRPSTVLTVIVLAAGVACALGWTVATGILGSLGSFPGATDTPGRAFVTMLADYTFNPGLIGYFGWLDAPAPDFVYAVWSFLSLGLVVLGLSVARGRRLSSLLVAIAGVVVVPAAVQAASVAGSGYIWQGRYALVAYVCAMLVALVAAGPAVRRWSMQPADRLEDRRRIAVRAAAIVAASVLIGQVWAFLEALRRSQGLPFPLIDVLLRPTWNPPGGVLVWTITISIGIMLAGAAVIIATNERRPSITERSSVYPSEAGPAENGR